MNINTLKEFELFIFFINIIFDYSYVNYPYKITLISIFLLILSFLKVFLNIFMNFKQFLLYYIFIKISMDIFYRYLRYIHKIQISIYLYSSIFSLKKQPLKFV